MNDTIKTGILSYGMSGELFHAPFIEDHPNFGLSAVVERSTKKAKNRYPNITSYNAVDELFADESIQLVVINTPNITHFKYALKAIEANKHILIEKPFTVTSVQAEQIYIAAEDKGLMVMPFQNRRYDSDYQSVKSVLESGDLGKLVEVHFRFDRFKKEIAGTKWKESNMAGSGLLYNLGSHLLDQVISLFGVPLKWYKSIAHMRPNTKIIDYAHIHLNYPNGLQVFVTTSLLVVDPYPAFVIHGSNGTFKKNRTDVQESQLNAGILPNNASFGVELSGSEGILTTQTNEGKKKLKKIVAEKANYRQVYEDVFQSLRNGKNYPVTKEQIITQLKIIESDEF